MKDRRLVRTGLASVVALLVPLSLSLVASTTASAETTKGNQLVCFDGESEGSGNGTCKLIENGAVFKNTAPGDYAGVYVRRDGLSGKPLSDVTQLSFKSTRNTAGGAPRFSLAIDSAGDGAFNYPTDADDFFAFADANGCSGGANDTQPNLVDVIHDPTCLISANGQSYPNWAAFMSAYPNARFAKASDQVSFIIADQPGDYRVVQVKMGKPAAHGA